MARNQPKGTSLRAKPLSYEARVRALEEEGMSTSDAQSVIDAEDSKKGGTRLRSEAPNEASSGTNDGVGAFQRLKSIMEDGKNGKQISLNELGKANNELARYLEQALSSMVVRENEQGVRIGESTSRGFLSDLSPKDKQIYTRWIVDEGNGKKATRFAQEALALVRSSRSFDKMTGGDVRDFVNDYVKYKLPEGMASRFKGVKWNAKSYPD